MAGNKSDIVQTTPGLYSSIYVIEQFTTQLKKESQKVYNLGNGAKFSATIAVNTQEFHPKNKLLGSNDLQKLEKYFHTSSINKLSKNELSKLHIKYNHALNIQNILRGTDIRSFNTIEDYIDFIYTKIIPKEEIASFQLSQILDTYLHYILSYIYDFFNVKESHETQEVHTLIKLLSQELLLISKVYIDSFSDKLTNEV
ncbi:MAG: hypothetical protein Q9M40_13975 [Sulfurimonas sp.]|nr:hypothetical protein [Sulfurimonas sp.]